MTALPIPSQEAAEDPFRFLVARGWRPSSAGDGTWRDASGRALEAQAAIDSELALPGAATTQQQETPA